MAKSLTEKDGRTLTIAMLRDMRERLDQYNVETAEYRNGGPQDISVLKGYLARAQASPSLEAGFLSVMSDYISSCADGGVPDPEFYERLERMRNAPEPGGESRP
jgi:hypothetical protein